MGASKKFKKILLDKDLTQQQFGEILGKDKQQVSNALYRDVFTYKNAEKWAEALGYEIVFREKSTGRIVD